VLLQVIQAAITSEQNHLTSTVRDLHSQSEDRLKQQISERMEIMDTFFEGIQLADETDTRKPVDLANELSGMLRLPLRLTPDQQRLLRDNSRAAETIVSEQVEALLTQQSILRLGGAVERRLEESLDLDSTRLAQEDWDTIGESILEGINQVFDHRQERFLGEQGSIVKDLDSTLARLNNPPLQRSHLTYLLMALTEGQRASFDKKTHRRVWTRTTRLIYSYYAAQLIKDSDPEDITADVLAHLEKAEETMRRSWGIYELGRLSGQTINSLDENTQGAIQQALGAEQTLKLDGTPLGNLPEESQQRLVELFGRRTLTSNYRGLLLGVITELWVDFLTQMEALRVSIGLEAYAQRDPLVQYKNQAFELFQELLVNMRLGVVTRMFTYRPRQAAAQTIREDNGNNQFAEENRQAQAAPDEEDVENDEETAQEEAVSISVNAAQATDRSLSSSKKRRRRRR
jgi:preprotein translocase subunit SecA